MFLIYNFFFLTHITTSSGAYQTPGLSQPANVPELTPYLNDIRTRKDLNDEKGTFYNEMIDRSKKLDEFNKILMCYSARLRDLAKKEYDCAMILPIGMNKSDLLVIKTLIILGYKQFRSLKKIRGNFISEIMNLIEKDIFKTIFTDLEKLRILMHLNTLGPTASNNEHKIKKDYEKIKNLPVITESEEINW